MDTCLLDELNPEKNSESWKHEGYMIPIVNWFEGKLKSTDDGKIIYIFPQVRLDDEEGRLGIFLRKIHRNF